MTCSNDFIDAGRIVETTQRVVNVWRSWDRTPFTGKASEPLMVIEAVKNPG